MQTIAKEMTTKLEKTDVKLAFTFTYIHISMFFFPGLAGIKLKHRHFYFVTLYFSNIYTTSKV